MSTDPIKYKRNFYEIKSNDEIFDKILLEREKIGYFSLPFQDVSKIKEYCKKITQKNIAIIGIGGSVLGVKAIYEFLSHSRTFNKKLICFDTIDPLIINANLQSLDISDTHFFVISKSGTTIEPISIFKYISKLIVLGKDNTTAITDKNSTLEKFAKKNSINSFNLGKNVGGRFSVFSNVGLMPLAAIGVDIEKLLLGCRTVHESFFNKEYFYDHIIKKARFLVENKTRFNINVIFSYSSIFRSFNDWFIQLWAESLGKLNINSTRQGLTPIALIGPKDQHSFLQLIVDGPRDKTVTFIKIDDIKDNTLIPNSESFSLFNSDYLNGESFKELLNNQADSTIDVIMKQKDIPCDVITIPTIDEENISTLMYRYQLLVSCIGAFMQINTYDQPGVELGKEILKEKYL